MNNSKIAGVVVLGVIVAGIAFVGVRQYLDYKRDAADRRAAECMLRYTQIVGDGRKPISAEALNPVLAEMSELSGRCSAEFSETLFSRRLDGAFLVGDFALAEKMMDDMPGKSQNWKAGAKAKIRAHAALEKGDRAAAIREFETFCQSLLNESPDTVEYDPCCGVEWSKEGLLARNLKRMSDLASAMGEGERAAKFLEDARRYARIALQKAEGDEDAKSAIIGEFGSLVN